MNDDQAWELNEARRALTLRLDNLQSRLRDTDEDSYATRNKIHDEISQYSDILYDLQHPRENTIDLTRRIFDYGYDPEAAACDRMCGLAHVSDFEREKNSYECAISELGDMINNLKVVGFEINEGVTRLNPPGDEPRLTADEKFEFLMDYVHDEFDELSRKFQPPASTIRV